jgi:hypothetical protein
MELKPNIIDFQEKGSLNENQIGKCDNYAVNV